MQVRRVMRIGPAVLRPSPTADLDVFFDRRRVAKVGRSIHPVECAAGHILCVPVASDARSVHAVLHRHSQCRFAGSVVHLCSNVIECAQKNVCYQLLALIGTIDMGAIILGGTLEGVLSIVGIPYCLHRWPFKTLSCCCACNHAAFPSFHPPQSSRLLSVAWFSYVATCAVLALCRCAQMRSEHMMQRL
jgi:hypothetical protein